MKTLILSDIHNETSNSVIPYSLRWARNMGTRAEILHVIDERETQGVYSPYSDSQSVTSDVELHPTIIKKEKTVAHNNLNKFMSKELPLLNHPLKLDYYVSVGNFEKELKEHVNKEDTLVLNSNDYVAHFDSLENLVNMIKSLPCQILCVPGNIEFKAPQKTLYVMFNEDESRERKQYVHDLLVNLQSYPEISQSYYANENEIEEKPVSDKDFELFYTIAPKESDSDANNIESLMETLNIDLLATQLNNTSDDKNTISKLLKENSTPMLFIPKDI